MNVTVVQNSGYFTKEIVKREENELKKESRIKKIVEEEKGKVMHLGETGLKEYNPRGKYREDYDTEKKLDLFA